MGYSHEVMGEGDYWEWMTPRRGTDVPEVLEVQEVPSVEVRMVPI